TKIISPMMSESRSSLRPWSLPFIFLPFVSLFYPGRRSIAPAIHFDLLIVQIYLSLNPPHLYPAKPKPSGVCEITPTIAECDAQGACSSAIHPSSHHIENR